MKKICFAVFGCFVFAAGASAQNLAPPTYTAEQAARGQAVFMEQCKGCHGEKLDNGEFAGPLRGPSFTDQWGGQGLDAVFDFMTQQMPPSNPGGLVSTTYADLLAFILSRNGVPAGATPLPDDSAALKAMGLPK